MTRRAAPGAPRALLRVGTTGLVVASLVSVLAGVGEGADPAVLIAQGKVLYQAGDLARAGDVFTQAAALAHQSARPALWAGAVAVARGDHAAAEAWFREALRRHPSLPEASCAVQWLDLLGVTFSRPRWHLHTPDEYAAFVHAVNRTMPAAQARWLGSALLSAADRSGIDPRLLAAVVFIESRFRHAAVSAAGAEGLGQLMPATAAGLGVDPNDAWQNLHGAAFLLKRALGEFRTLPLALAAYNAGGPAVRRWGGIPPYAETQWYVWAVLWTYDGLKG